MSDNTPKYPFSQAAEEALLGAIMLDPELFPAVALIVSGEQFYRPQNQIIFKQLGKMHERNIPLDIISIQEYLKEKKLLKKAGGAVYLDQLFDNVPASRNAWRYAGVIRKMATYRDVMNLGQDAWIAGQESTDIDASIDELHKKMLELTLQKSGRNAELLSTAMIEFEERYHDKVGKKSRGELKRPLGYGSGFQTLDKIIGGFRPSAYSVIAARPSIGKTALAIAIALNVARAGGKVLFITLEMPFSAIIHRMLANITSINSLKIDKIVNEDEYYTIKHGIDQLKNYQMVVADVRITGSKLSNITREIRRWSQTLDGLDLVVVDYLQLITAPARSDAERIGISSLELKRLAIEIDSPILALAQINRMGKKNPTEDDMFGSDQPAHGGDLIITLSGDKGKPSLGVNVTKHKFGTTGKLTLKYNRQYNQFEDIGDGTPPDTTVTVPPEQVADVMPDIPDDDISEYDH